VTSCRAECYKLGAHVAFARQRVDRSPDDPFSAHVTMMVGANATLSPIARRPARR
jgi:hypothetical protein